MRFTIGDRLELRLSVPVWCTVRGPPQLELALPAEHVVEIPPLDSAYLVRTSMAADEAGLIGLLRRAGFPFDEKQLGEALRHCLPNGCFVVQEVATGNLVSTMMARHLSTPSYPFGGRIDWLATDPDHRGSGLAKVAAGSAAQRLLEAGYSKIWVTTDDHRIGALKTFLSLGFLPVISPAVVERWSAVRDQLGPSHSKPFEGLSTLGKPTPS
jgi:mycothiol synthase